MGRIEIICSMLSPAKVFADVGCDHGYCSEYVLKNGLCERAYVTDVSAESLKKAERLLEKYISAGRCIPVCCDGLSAVEEPCDLVLIAGLGGEEIIHILDEVPLPERFVLQPMKNTERLRRYLIARGGRLTADFTFRDGKFYELIAGERGKDCYSEREYRYGRDNLKTPSPDFRAKLLSEREKLLAYSAEEMQEGSREQLNDRLSEITEVLNEIGIRV